MIRLLVISLEFPPVNSTGCYRYLKFLRYFGRHHIEPTVFAPTVESSLNLWQNRKQDDSLLKRLPDNLRIYRIPLPKNARVNQNEISLFTKAKGYFRYKDNASKLWQSAVEELMTDLVREKKFDALFVSAPPFSLCKLGADLSRKFDLPLILDMRDDWILNKGYPFLTYWHFKKIRAELELALSVASRVLFVTEQLIEITKKIFPLVSSHKYRVIHNGFDLDHVDFGDFAFNSKLESRKVRIGYAGEFYYDPKAELNARRKWWQRRGVRKLNYNPHLSREDWKYRSPYYFLRTLNVLFQKYPEWKGKIVFEHIGNAPAWLFAQVKEWGLEANFISHGFLSKSANLTLQSSFDALLCTSEKIIEGMNYCISSKLFDAVILRKPILGFVTDGESKNFIQKSRCGVIFDPDQSESSADALHTFLSESHIFSPDRNFLRKFMPDFLTMGVSNCIYEALEMQVSHEEPNMIA